MIVRWVVVGVLVAVTVAIMVAMGLGYVECRDAGGQYVRGLFWMECIDEEVR